MQKINNKNIWITGASSGIGEACAYIFAREQANLILTSSNADKLTVVSSKCIKLGAKCTILPYDLSNLEDLDKLTNQAISIYGTIDVMFHNAGISQRGKAIDTIFEVDSKIMDINYFAPVKITKQLLPSMIKNGGGTIAVTSSITGKFGFPLRSAYSASKFALYGFFETVHAEYYDNHIRVVMVCPGRVKTNISKNALEADGKQHNSMDEGQATGMSADKAAIKIVKAIKAQKPEVLIGGKEIIMVYLKRLLPSVARNLVRKVKET